jgi:hypothetical protein
MAIRASDRASLTGRLRLTVDDAGLDGQLLDRGRHEREAVGEIMAVSGELPNATAAPICQDAESIVVIAATCNPTGDLASLCSRRWAAASAETLCTLLRHSGVRPNPTENRHADHQFLIRT